MDIVVIQANAYELPTSRRVGVIVHDGTTDLRLWPGPGPDRELSGTYGPELARVLDTERARANGGGLALGQPLRLHPGKLHCDFLVWLASRGPEKDGYQAPAPTRDVIERGVRAVLEFVSERNVVRIAFPALGAGPSQSDDAERLAWIARASNAYYEGLVGQGKGTTIEEVLICDPRLSVVTQARRLAGALAKAPAPEKPSPLTAAAPLAKEKKPAKPRAERAPSSRGKPRLEEREVAWARSNARPWDRTARYNQGDWFIHAKFGVGRVTELTPDGFVMVLFEDGEARKLIHAR